MATSRNVPDMGVVGMMRQMQRLQSDVLSSSMALGASRVAKHFGSALNSSPMGALAIQLQQGAQQVAGSPLFQAIAGMQSVALPELVRQAQSNSILELVPNQALTGGAASA